MQAPSPSADPNPTADRTSRLAWLLLALSVLWCLLWFVHARGYWEDDAWIHLEFARSLASGHGFSFNGHIVYGDTSPLWVWLLAAFHALIPDWITAGKTLTAAAALFALAGVYAFARSLTHTLTPAKSRLFSALMVLILVTNPYFGYWAFSGMEALAAAGLVCWGLTAAAPAQPSPLRFLLGCITVGLAPLLRPEMSFFSLLLGLLLLFRWWNLAADLPRRLALLAAGFGLAIVPFALWARYALHTFGMVVPNTNAAKRADPHDNIPSRLLQIYSFGFPVVLISLALLLAWCAWHLLRGRRRQPLTTPSIPATAWLLFLWTAINCIFYTANHTYVQTRYVFVTAPVLTLALLALARLRWPRLYVPLAAFALVFGVAVSFLATWPLVHNKVEVDRTGAELAAFVRTLPPDAPVALYSIGESAFLSEHPIVDTGGITRPGIIPFLWDATDIRRLAWMRSQGAKYLVVDHQPTPGAVMLWTHDIPTTGWYLNPRRYSARERLQLWTLPSAP